MSKLPTGGYQPTNRPENLIPPNKGPSYKPKEEKIKQFLVEKNSAIETLTEDNSNRKDALIQEVYNIWSILSPYMWW